MATSLYGRGMAYAQQNNRPMVAADITAAKRIDPDIANKFRRWGVEGP